MDWISYSALMFVSSVALYLVVRKASLQKISTSYTNLAMFILPLFVFVPMALLSGEGFGLSPMQALVLFVASVIFAYGGSTASLRAIDIAPNPGYSLVLSKSYVLFTTIVAVVLLGEELTVRSAAAILVIVAFSALIMLGGKTKKVTGNNWVALSFVAFFSWGMLSLSSKYLFNDGLPTIMFLLYLYALVTVCILIADRAKLKQYKELKKADLWLLLAIGAGQTAFNYGQFSAIRLAPNLGYVNAINAGSIALVTVMAVVFFKDELTLRKGIGVLGVTAGLLLLVL